MVDGLLSGRSGITYWQQMPPGVQSRLGGDLSSFNAADHLATWADPYATQGKSILRASSQPARMVAASIYQALESASVLDRCDERTAHVHGGHNTNERFVYEQAGEFASDPEFVDPLYALTAYDTDPLAASNELFGIRGPAFTVGGACASSNVALVVALDLLRTGRADRAVVSSVAMEASPLALQGFALIDALAGETFSDQPTRASRPFDVRREGFVPSEGAAAVVIEAIDSAVERGAHIHALLLGGAIASAACRGTRTDVGAQGRAIGSALTDAGVEASQVDYINAHATSTPIGDRNEVDALRRVFGARLGGVAINASKSMLGHALQAAGMLELIAVVGQIEAGRVHPTLNLDEVDPAMRDLDLVRECSRRQQVEVALSNAFGFGGVNAILVVGRV